MPRKKRRNTETRSRSNSVLRRPIVQLFILLVVAAVVYLIALSGNSSPSASPPSEVSVDQAYTLTQAGAFLLDVRTLEEWNEYRARGATHIPLDQLSSRLNELPKDKQIVVICRSGNRSQQGRDILLDAGFQATSVSGGLKEWFAKGYPVEGAPQN